MRRHPLARERSGGYRAARVTKRTVETPIYFDVKGCLLVSFFGIMRGMTTLARLRATAMYALLVGLCACGGQTSSMAPSQLPPGPSGPQGVNSSSAAATSAKQTLGASNDSGSYKLSQLSTRQRVAAVRSVPLVIPVWGEGGDGQDTDPGAIADRHLFAVVLDNSAPSSRSLASNCPGVSSTSTCQPYKYINLFHNLCKTPATMAAYQFANSSDESAIMHTYPGPKTKGNRLVFAATRSNCPGSSDAYIRMAPGDPAFISWLYNHVWNGSDYTNDFPRPYGIMEDTAGVLAWISVGGVPGSKVSTEYGSGVSPSGFANKIGDSRYHAATDWETAIGKFVNGACGGNCVDMAFNGVATGAGNARACSDIRDGHCHSPGQSGLIDDQSAIDNICHTVSGGNLKYMMAERPIFAGRFGYTFLDSQTVTTFINTNANLYTHTSDGCAKTKIVAIETSYGQGGPGDITGGYRVRLATLAFRWLVANPQTGIPDRVISMLYSEGGTRSEAPYFFEDTLVPYGAEVSVPKFVWNGRVETIGGGCPSRAGDSGGAVSLLAQCVGSSGIFCQQYEHLYVNGADHGKMAVCFNTSTATEHVASSWFKHDPMSSYHYVLALRGGEMTSVPYKGVQGGSIRLSTCTNGRYCSGSNSLAAQTTAFRGSGEVLCGPCGLVLLQSN